MSFPTELRYRLEYAGFRLIQAAISTRPLEAASREYLEAREPQEALRLFEQLGDWRAAGACAEQLGNKERAAELYMRIGDYEAAERARGNIT